MNLDEINNRIENEICFSTIKDLSDEKLISQYLKCKSVKNQVNKLKNILTKYKINTEIQNSILKDFLIELIPAGTKGIIRGNKFNLIVKNKILGLNLDKKIFKIEFEKQCENCITSEIPDWYILNKKTNKLIVGMNQLDLWNGGQQLNRGNKYLINNLINTKNSKLLCVVCNKITFKNEKSKSFKLFEIGFSNNTLCYLNNLENIIKNFFNL